MKIVCDPAAASQAMDTIDQRHEALMGHLWGAIRNGIEAHNTLEQSHGFACSTPAEFEKALAAPSLGWIGSTSFLSLCGWQPSLTFTRCSERKRASCPTLPIDPTETTVYKLRPSGYVRAWLGLEASS